MEYVMYGIMIIAVLAFLLALYGDIIRRQRLFKACEEAIKKSRIESARARALSKQFKKMMK